MLTHFQGAVTTSPNRVLWLQLTLQIALWMYNRRGILYTSFAISSPESKLFNLLIATFVPFLVALEILVFVR